MGRTENGHYDGKAGIHLLEALNKRGSQIPFVVFSSSQAAQRFREQLKVLGGRAITSSTIELRAILDELAPGTNDEQVPAADRPRE
jgi:hypothetical protein